MSDQPDRRYARKSPCAACPFNRSIKPGATGGSDVTVFIGQAAGPFLLSCHADPDYPKDQRSTKLMQCAGAAIYRANTGQAARLPDALHKLAAGHPDVFATAEEFMAHHRRISLAEAAVLLQETPVTELLRQEFKKSGVEVLKIQKKVDDGNKLVPS